MNSQHDTGPGATSDTDFPELVKPSALLPRVVINEGRSDFSASKVWSYYILIADWLLFFADSGIFLYTVLLGRESVMPLA